MFQALLALHQLLQLTVYNSVHYMYSTPKNFQHFFCMQGTNIPSSHFIQFIVILDNGPKSPRHVGVRDFYNMILTLIVCIFFFCLNYSN
jgi:hypothetical protein